jgi:transcriptional regulator CtsR
MLLEEKINGKFEESEFIKEIKVWYEEIVEELFNEAIEKIEEQLASQYEHEHLEQLFDGHGVQIVDRP